MPSVRKLIDEIRSQAKRLAQAAADAEYWHEQWLEQVKTDQTRRMLDAEAACQQAIAKARSAYERRLKQASDDHERRIAGAGDRQRQTMTATEREYQTTLADVAGRIETLTRIPSYAMTPWGHSVWGSWTPTTAVQSSPSTRIGQLVERGQWHRISLPALPEFLGKLLLFESTGGTKTHAVQAMQSLLLRLLAIVPPARLQFTFVDPVGRGQNVAAFMHLADYDDKLVTGRAWTEARHIEQRLVDLTEHIENVIQKYLRDDYPTIEAYNEDAVVVAEPVSVQVSRASE